MTYTGKAATLPPPPSSAIASPAHRVLPARRVLLVWRKILPRRFSLPLIRLALLTLAALAIHGYHFGADDSAVYLPAVLKTLHPGLYPYGSEFFESHAKLSQFAAIVAVSVRVTHLDETGAIFLWYVGCTFAFLLAAWQLASVCFDSERARWSAVLLITTTLTVPVTGTALVLMDPYLTARSAATPLLLFATTAFLQDRRKLAGIWLIAAAIVHPLMAVYGAACLLILALPSRWAVSLLDPRPAAAAAFPMGFSLTPAALDYRESLDMRPFLFVLRWSWYEWFGVAAPLAFLLWCSRTQFRGASPALHRISRALILLGLLSTFVAVLFSSSPALESLVRLQPMRSFQLLYIVFFVLLGGLLGEYLLQSHRWRWAALFTAIAAGMFLVQRDAYAHSRHIEWPLAAPANPWVAAFQWIRNNTPENAVFALDPNYILLPGEDQHGFRAFAQRSVLSDYVKDSGVVSLFPQLAAEWQQEQQAQSGWSRFQLADFQHLARRYPVSWVVLSGITPHGLDCRYTNQAVSVCRIPGAAGLP